MTRERGSELSQLHNRIKLTLRFLGEIEDWGELGEEFQAATDRAFRKGSVRELRQIAREIDAVTIAIPTHQREGLEAILRLRAGVDKDQERALKKLEVAQSLERGMSVSEKERQRLADYVEMLEATQGDVEEIAAERALLSS